MYNFNNSLHKDIKKMLKEGKSKGYILTLLFNKYSHVFDINTIDSLIKELSE